MRIENVLSATVHPYLQPTVFDSIKLPVAVITDINKIQSGYTDLSMS